VQGFCNFKDKNLAINAAHFYNKLLKIKSI